MEEKIKEVAVSARFATIDPAVFGVKLAGITPEKARATLKKAGADTGAMSDKEALIVYSATGELAKIDKSVKNVSLALGLLSTFQVWKTAVAPNGKKYKSENAYLKGRFPGYATSTVSLYADVGKSIYIPIMRGVDGYKGLESLEDMSPANLKFLLSVIKDKEMRKALPAKLDEIHKKAGKLGQRELAQVAKELKEEAGKVSPRTADESESVSDAEINDDLAGKAMAMAIRKAVLGEKSDGEIHLCITEDGVNSFIDTLNNAISNVDMGILFMKEFAAYIKQLNK